MTSKRHIFSFLSIPGLVFGHVSSIGRLPSLSIVMTIFGKSRDLKTKTPKTQAACVFLQRNKCLKVECIQMQKLTYGFAVICITKKVMTS